MCVAKSFDDKPWPELVWSSFYYFKNKVSLRMNIQTFSGGNVVLLIIG